MSFEIIRAFSLSTIGEPPAHSPEDQETKGKGLLTEYADDEILPDAETKKEPEPTKEVEKPAGSYAIVPKHPEDVCWEAFLKGALDKKGYERCLYKTAGFKRFSPQIEGGATWVQSFYRGARDGTDVRLAHAAVPTFKISLSQGQGYVRLWNELFKIDAGLVIYGDSKPVNSEQLSGYARGTLLADLAPSAFVTFNVRAYDMHRSPLTLQTELVGSGFGAYGQLFGGPLGTPEELEGKITGQLADGSYFLFGGELNGGLILDYGENTALRIAEAKGRSDVNIDLSWKLRGEGIEEFSWWSIAYEVVFQHQPLQGEAYVAADVSLELFLIPQVQLFLKGHAGHLFPWGEHKDPLYPDYQTEFSGSAGIRIVPMAWLDPVKTSTTQPSSER